MLPLIFALLAENQQKCIKGKMYSSSKTKSAVIVALIDHFNKEQTWGIQQNCIAVYSCRLFLSTLGSYYHLNGICNTVCQIILNFDCRVTLLLCALVCGQVHIINRCNLHNHKSTYWNSNLMVIFTTYPPVMSSISLSVLVSPQ